MAKPTRARERFKGKHHIHENRAREAHEQPRSPHMKLYEQLTEHVAALIREGALRSGDRAPSVRELSRNRGASPATVVHAYELLQASGYLESPPRSGFFVSNAWRRSRDDQRASQPARRPAQLDVSNLVFEVLEAMRARDVVPLGSAFPSPELFPHRQLARCLAASAQRLDPWSTVEDLPPGNMALRRQIAQRYLLAGARVLPEEIVVTSGALEALNLALQVVTEPKDVVAIESPTFYACLQAVESSGRRAVEVPTHPRDGVDVDELERILDREPVRACWLMTAFQNPLGATMPLASRSRLVRLLAARDIPLIEDRFMRISTSARSAPGRPRCSIARAWCSTAGPSPRVSPQATG